MTFVRGQRVTWHCLTFGLRSGVVTEDSCGLKTRVRCDDSGNEEYVPTGWLASTGEYLALPPITRLCPACQVADAVLFGFERPHHTCERSEAA